MNIDDIPHEPADDKGVNYLKIFNDILHAPITDLETVIDELNKEQLTTVGQGALTLAGLCSAIAIEKYQHNILHSPPDHSPIPTIPHPDTRLPNNTQEIPDIGLFQIEGMDGVMDKPITQRDSE